MAFGGRGRGGGWGGGRSGGFARPQKFELFPELQDNVLPKASRVKEEIDLMIWSHRLQTFWNSSAYYLEDKRINKEENTDIERYSDRGKKRKLQKDKLSDFIKCTVDYVPAELALGSKSVQYGRKKVRWNQDAGLKIFDSFEKREQKGGGKGKEDEGEEEEEEIVEEDQDEYSDDGDYEQNVDFDDDEDDFNMPEDNNDDEGYY